VGIWIRPWILANGCRRCQRGHFCRDSQSAPTPIEAAERSAVKCRDSTENLTEAHRCSIKCCD
jgi:hypothetical protein